MALLELKNVSRYYGGLAAIDDFSFEVSPQEILGLIGPNGAGKTTTFNLISGFLRPNRGQINYSAMDITGLKPHRVAELGIIRTFQLNILFHHLTVLENVEAGHYLYSRLNLMGALVNTRTNRKKELELKQKSLEILEFLELADYAQEKAINLPHGLQRLLGVAVALAAKPKLLLLDEPLTGMNTIEVESMIQIIRKVRDKSGATIVVVEHNMPAVMTLCERLVVMNFGRKIAEGLPAEIANNYDVIEAYLGSKAHDA